MTREDKLAIGIAIGIAATVAIVGLAFTKKAKADPKPVPKIPVPTPDVPSEELRTTVPEHLGWHARGGYTIVTGNNGDGRWYWAVFGEGAENEDWAPLFATQAQSAEGVENAWWDARLAANRWVDERQPEAAYTPQAPFKVLADAWGTTISTAWGKMLAPTWLVEGATPPVGEVLGWYTYKGVWIRVVGIQRDGGTLGSGTYEWAVMGGDTPIALGRADETATFEDMNTDWAAGKAAEWIDAVVIGAGGDEGAGATAVDVALDDDAIGAGRGAGHWGAGARHRGVSIGAGALPMPNIGPLIMPLPIKFPKRKRD
jgi:hypothetical protein